MVARVAAAEVEATAAVKAAVAAKEVANPRPPAAH
jgi:hypothetical protein